MTPSKRLPRLRRSPDAVSPTAHYTGHVWARNGLGPAELDTRTGAVLHGLLAPLNAVSGRLGGPTLEGLLLGRHQVMDDLLHAAIKDGRISQVVEIASGMSPRGQRFSEQYGEALAYVEADLPAMADRKRRALEGLPRSTTHAVVDFDALREDGPGSLASVMASLDPTRGTAIITEGLLNYLPPEAVRTLWGRLGAELARFPAGVYISDLHLSGELRGGAARGFGVLLAAFVRGRIHFHFADAPAAEKALHESGFDRVVLHRLDDPALGVPARLHAGARLARVIEAWTEAPA
ncbi:class I SAM-dependent methyltransferase [Nocardioides cavernaquae]|uniref:Class I SAM-dependent methyltransferase n=1 Tax=Nocardioides cavernaquae TaxID=2321396 RepID=A0A3A5HBJ0_9ACTN|nr:class I SAM-dependent methyltransferase [Nocardioides cavernaquae]RJS47993.1 class I SAM-dependent methyltransferase [Nocardioides cavernaquae]